MASRAEKSCIFALCSLVKPSPLRRISWLVKRRSLRTRWSTKAENCSQAALAVITAEEHMAPWQGSYPREVQSMTERNDHRTGSEGVKDTVRDELAESQDRR